MEATHTASSRTRPSASTGGTGLGALFFGLSAGPLAWYIQLVINYALASHTCFPDGSPLVRPPAGWLGINITLFAVNIAAIVLALAASLVSLRIWVAVRHNYPAPHSDILALAIGRARFLALTGAMAGLGSMAATVFTLIALALVPPCAG